jgi:hypothetical protein
MFFAYRDKPKLDDGDHIIKVIADCLSFNPAERPTADEVVARIQAIVDDDREYFIHPATPKKVEMTADSQTNKQIAKIFEEDVTADPEASAHAPLSPRPLDILDTLDFAEQPHKYKQSPATTVLNTNFGVQPTKVLPNKKGPSVVNILAPKPEESIQKPAEEKRYWGSEVAPPQDNEISPIFILLMVFLVLAAIGVASVVW